ncbi:ISL3 family transposase [Enterococcus italicus]
MSTSDSIKQILEVKDKNIEILSCQEGFYKGKKVILAEAALIRTFHRCPLCKVSSEALVRNGKKVSMILLNRCANKQTYLRLKKQRYHCRACHKYFTAQTYLVNRHCFISKQVHYHVLEELTENQSMKNIANHCHISVTTVQRTLSSLAFETKIRKSWLPKCLLFDEFRSLTTHHGTFSFSCMDGNTGKLFDILPSRQKKDLVAYFMRFDRKAREKVRYIVTDMNAPYFSLMKECFPNAKAIVDRFHIVQHLNKGFNQVRIRVMKQLNTKDKKQAKYYRQLKSLYKLLLKPADKLDFMTFKKRRNFNWSYLTETEVVDRLLAISPELKAAYSYYQELLSAYRDKDSEQFFQLLHSQLKELPKELQQVKKAFFTYESGIRLAFTQPYSNGRLENLHTHIKTLKRVAYGFRNFSNMRTRIFLLNGLITYK